MPSDSSVKLSGPEVVALGHNFVPDYIRASLFSFNHGPLVAREECTGFWTLSPHKQHCPNLAPDGSLGCGSPEIASKSDLIFWLV